MRRFFTSLFTLFISIVFVGNISVHAFSFPGAGGGSSEHTVIISNHMQDYVKEYIILEEDDTLELSDFPIQNEAFPLSHYYAYLDTTGSPYMLEIMWNLSNPSFLEPGTHEILATPVLEDNMILTEGYDPTISWPLFRKGAGATLPIQSLHIPGVSYPILAQNSTPEATLPTATTVINCHVSDYLFLNTKKDPDFQWIWDYSEVDTTTLGHYPVTGTLQYPDWVTVPKEYTTVTDTVYVLPEDRIEIYAPYQTTSNGVLELRWYYDGVNVSDVVLEQKNDDNAWEPCNEEWFKYQKRSTSHGHDSLNLYLLKMPTETPLILRLQYQDIVNGEAATRYTESITLTVPDNIAELINSGNKNVTINILSGDRDGGDTEEDELPEYEQPAPTLTPSPDDTPVPENSQIPETSPVPEAASVPSYTTASRSTQTQEQKATDITEVVTDTYTAISGLRLQALINSGSTVLFEKQGLSLEIPSALLENLKLDSDDLLEVTIKYLQDDQIHISVAVNGVSVDDLSGSILYLPWNEFIEINTPGTYDIEIPEDTKPEATDNDGIVQTERSLETDVSDTKRPIMPVILCIIGVFALILFIIYRIRKGTKHG